VDLGVLAGGVHGIGVARDERPELQSPRDDLGGLGVFGFHVG
jgi:hypothetical protein